MIKFNPNLNGEVDGFFQVTQNFNFYEKNLEYSGHYPLVMWEMENKNISDYNLNKGDTVILSVKNNFNFIEAFNQIMRQMRQFYRLMPSEKKHFILLLTKFGDFNNDPYSNEIAEINKVASGFKINLFVGIIKNEKMFKSDLIDKISWHSEIKKLNNKNLEFEKKFQNLEFNQNLTIFLLVILILFQALIFLALKY